MPTAAKDFTATFNGRDYSYRKGEAVDVPPVLLANLKKDGIVKETRTKKENADD